MNARTLPPLRTEPRWPVMVALIAVFGMIMSLPSRYQFAPAWFPWTAFVITMATILAVALVPGSRLLRHVERVTVLVLAALMLVLNVMAVRRLVVDMVTHQHGYSSLTLLESAAVIWTVNVILFAIIFWQASSPADFHFAEAEDAGDEKTWEPRFVDFLYLAFVTSTSF